MLLVLETILYDSVVSMLHRLNHNFRVQNHVDHRKISALAIWVDFQILHCKPNKTSRRFVREALTKLERNEGV